MDVPMTTYECANKHTESAVQIARDGLKAILFINAGAAVALIALTDRSNGDQEYTTAIVAFGVGALFAAVAYVFGYFSQAFYADHTLENADENKKVAYHAHRKHIRLLSLAVGSAMVGVICAATGMLVALDVQRPTFTGVQPIATHQVPTVTEIFNLRSQCADLGQKILDQNVINSALAQEESSHYNPKTNRCYVELDVHSADLTKARDVDDRYLYDGQTKDKLAFAVVEYGKKIGFGGDNEPNEPDYDRALEKVVSLMADDRQQ
jgi:hypothetical protein